MASTNGNKENSQPKPSTGKEIAYTIVEAIRTGGLSLLTEDKKDSSSKPS